MPVQKDKGWEFTSLERFDPSAYPRRTARARDAPAHEPVIAAQPATCCPDGVIVGSLASAAAEHPELVERHLGTLLSDGDKFSAQNTAAWEEGAFVYVPAGVPGGEGRGSPGGLRIWRWRRSPMSEWTRIVGPGIWRPPRPGRTRPSPPNWSGQPSALRRVAGWPLWLPSCSGR